jgi:hypothetical protein
MWYEQAQLPRAGGWAEVQGAEPRRSGAMDGSAVVPSGCRESGGQSPPGPAREGRMLEHPVHQPLSRLLVGRAQGSMTELSELVAGRPTPVVFWSRRCAPAGALLQSCPVPRPDYGSTDIE